MQTTEPTQLPAAANQPFPLQAHSPYGGGPGAPGGYGPPPGGGGGGYGPPGGGGPGAPGGYGPPPGGGGGGYGPPPGPGPGATVLGGGPPPGMGGPPPGGAPPPPNAAGGPKKKGPPMGLILGGVGGVLLIGGAIAAWMMLRGAPVFPVPADKMPEDLTSVTRINIETLIADSNGIERGDVPKQALWSAYADGSFCRGNDVFETLMEADDPDAHKRIAKFVEDKKDTAKYLTCGKEVADATERNVYILGVGSSKKGGQLVVVSSKLEELPTSGGDKPGKWKVKGLSPAFCKGSECKDDEGSGLGRIENTKFWVEGSFKPLEDFADGYDGRSKVSKDVENIEKVAKKVSGADSFSAGVASENNMPSFALESGAGGFGGRDEVDPEDKDAVEKKEKAAKKMEKAQKTWKDVGAYYARGSKRKGIEGKVEYYWMASKEGDAKDLADALKDILDLDKESLKNAEVSDLRSEIMSELAAKGQFGHEIFEKASKEKDKGKLKDLLKEAQGLEAKDKDKKSPKENKVKKAYDKARRAVARRALEKAEISQDGEWVTLTIEYEAEDDEKTAFEEYQKAQSEKIEPASKVVEALLNGEKPEKDLLKTLGGQELLDAMDKKEGDDSDKKKEDE